MSQFNIEVIDVDYADVPTKNGKGTYGKLTVTHKTDDGKVDSKALLDFGTPKEVFAKLQQATKGTRLAVTRQKNEKGYWDWTEVSTQLAAAPQAAAAPASGSSYGRSFESAEERAAKQTYIIKQSSLATAVAFLQGKEASSSDVIKVAQEFVDYVMGTRVQDMSDDIPF